MLKKALKVFLSLTAILSLAFAIFWFSRDRDVSFPELKSGLPHAAFSKFIDVGGVNIHYQDKGTGTPLVLIHGYSSSTYSWRDVFLPLSENYRVIAIDLKGFGFSDKPPGDYSRLEQAKIVSRFLDRINVQRAWLAGNSMGGEVAINVALRHPEKVEGLVLIDSAGVGIKGKTSLAPWYLKTPVLGSVLTAISLTSDKLVREGLAKSFYDDSKVTEESVRTYYQPLKTRDGQEAAIQAQKQFVQFPVENDLNKIRAPAILIWGKEDDIIPVEAGRKMHTLISGSEFVEIERCGHLPQEEMPGRVVDEVKRFMKNHSIGLR